MSRNGACRRSRDPEHIVGVLAPEPLKPSHFVVAHAAVGHAPQREEVERIARTSSGFQGPSKTRDTSSVTVKLARQQTATPPIASHCDDAIGDPNNRAYRQRTTAAARWYAVVAKQVARRGHEVVRARAWSGSRPSPSRSEARALRRTVDEPAEHSTKHDGEWMMPSMKSTTSTVARVLRDRRLVGRDRRVGLVGQRDERLGRDELEGELGNDPERAERPVRRPRAGGARCRAGTSAPRRSRRSPRTRCRCLGSRRARTTSTRSSSLRPRRRR